MTDTIKDHLDNCKQVSQVIADANALLTRAHSELLTVRDVLEVLLPYQHEKMIVGTAHRSWSRDKSSMTAVEVIRVEIDRLNKFIGDRA